MLFESFKQGINLGGFLSQYELIADAGSEESLHNHFETFITEDDIRRIASWDLIMSESPWMVICFIILRKRI